MAKLPKSDDLTLVVPKSFWLASEANLNFVGDLVRILAHPSQVAEYEEGQDMVFAIHEADSDSIPGVLSKIATHTPLSIAFHRSHDGMPLDYQKDGYRQHSAMAFLHLMNPAEAVLKR